MIVAFHPLPITTDMAIDVPNNVVPKARATGRRLHGALVRKLAIEIMSGVHAPGSPLAAQPALADRLGVSRGSLREAMSVLAAKGLVEARPQSGIRILPRSNWKVLDPDMLSWAFSSTPCPSYIQAIFELRALIEPGAARLAARRRSPADLDKLGTAIKAMLHSPYSSEASYRATQDFHTGVLQATQNDMLVSIAASIGATALRTLQNLQRPNRQMRHTIPDHVEVFQAILTQDETRAEMAMQRLVDLSLNDISLKDESTATTA